MLRKIKHKKRIGLVLTAFMLFVVFSFFLQNSKLQATSSLQMNFSGKIVSDSGLDVSHNPPACVGVGADACHFQIKYYNGSSGGTLLGSEVFENVELGDYRGYFNLKFGSGAFTAGSHTSLKNIFLNEPDVYIEVLFDPTGNVTPDFDFGTNQEVELFLVAHDPVERMAVGAAPYSISTRGAIDEFQLKVKESTTGTTAGLMYFDGGANFVKVHDGTDWRSLSYLLWEENISGDIAFSSGDVTVGSSGDNSNFSVYGDSLFTGDLVVDGEVKVTQELVGGVSVGAVHIDSAGKLIYDASSLRYKRNIESYGSVLSKLSNLDLVHFTWNELTRSSGKRDIGMIAEDVAKYIPELVLYNSFGQVQGLKYDRMGAFAIAGLSELKTEFDYLREMLAEDEEELKVYHSEVELAVGNLVVRDFTIEDGLRIFENSHLPLYGVVSEILYEEDEILGYHIVEYTGFGQYEVLIERGEDSVEIFEPQVALGLGIGGSLVILEEEDVSSQVLGYTLDSLEFEEEELAQVSTVYITYSPLVFGSSSLSLFGQDFEDSSRLSFGGGHINIKGHRGEFTFLKTGVLEVTGEILIHSQENEVYPLLERITELENRLVELEGGIE